MIDASVKLRRNVCIFDPKLVNLFGCEIDENSFIGPFVEITRGVVVGKNCKIESHSFICDGVKIEDDVFIGHGVMFTNDLYPKTDRHVKSLPTVVKKGSSIGSNATIIAGVTIGEYSIVGAGSVISKNVPDFSIAAGNPVRVLKKFINIVEMQAYMSTKQSVISK